MKVLMLGWELPPYNSGGLGVACLQLCKTLHKKGAMVTFVVPYDKSHDFSFMEVISANIADVSSITGAYDSTSFLSGKSGLNGSTYDISTQYATAIESLVREKEFSVIHAHDWLTFRAGLRARELTRKPLILHVHSLESDRAGGPHGNPLVHEIEKTGFMLADRIVAVSELTKQKIIVEYNIPGDKITVAHNSIDLEDMPELDGDNAYKLLTGYKQNGYRIVANVGRLTIQKGLSNLLVAARSVIEKEPKTIFLIVGSGDQRNELIQLGASLGISRNLIFAGFQRGKEWRDTFDIADLFVMPSVSEPFGLTPLEASFYGTPSLISKQSGISEVLMNCLKVDFWDTDKMANQIVAVVRYQGLRDELSKSATDELRHLSWHNAAEILMDTYRAHAGATA